MQWHSILAKHQPWRWAQDFLVISATTEYPLYNFQGLIVVPYATSMVLSPQPRCLACPSQESKAISQPFQVALLWVLGTSASAILTQQQLGSWDHKRIGLEVLRVPCSHPAPCLRKTSTNENWSMVKGREGKGMTSMWKKENSSMDNGGITWRCKD